MTRSEKHLREITAVFPHKVEIAFLTYRADASFWLISDVPDSDWTAYQTGSGAIHVFFKNERKAFEFKMRWG